jgi:hypothetical protein
VRPDRRLVVVVGRRVGPVEELEDADDVATGLDKLTEAFPGAALVDPVEGR